MIELPEFFDGFTWAVPTAFSDALAKCLFEPGDLLYDARDAYREKWEDAARYVSYSIQVKGDHRTSEKPVEDSASVFLRNWRSETSVLETNHREDRTREVYTTQGNIYTLIWKGKMSRSWYLETAKPPLRTDNDSATLQGAALKVLELLQKEYASTFLMPHDLTSKLYLGKIDKIRQKAVEMGIGISEKLFTPEELDVPSCREYVPTARFAVFGMSCDSSRAHEFLKSALYTPSKDKITNRDAFKLKTHGLLISKGENRTED